jgi:DNA-binding transcriptional MerR regulator
MLKIGKFSRLGQVLISFLRYYADLGLLPPAEIDHQTGYRYNALEQLLQVYRILAMRDMGLSLEQIGVMVHEPLSSEQLYGMLRLRQSELSQQIAAGVTERLGSAYQASQHRHGSTRFSEAHSSTMSVEHVKSRGTYPAYDTTSGVLA